MRFIWNWKCGRGQRKQLKSKGQNKGKIQQDGAQVPSKQKKKHEFGAQPHTHAKTQDQWRHDVNKKYIIEAPRNCCCEKCFEFFGFLLSKHFLTIIQQCKNQEIKQGGKKNIKEEID